MKTLIEKAVDEYYNSLKAAKVKLKESVTTVWVYGLIHDKVEKIEKCIIIETPENSQATECVAVLSKDKKEIHSLMSKCIESDGYFYYKINGKHYDSE
tara:strand:+ start:288 stop:581 length:294 start_codon:yes stop_codon:yes gene_type:complete